MARQERLPKKEYFAKRYAEAVLSGNTQKADYFKKRFDQEVAKCETPVLTRHEVGGIVFYSCSL